MNRRPSQIEAAELQVLRLLALLIHTWEKSVVTKEVEE